MLYLGNSSPTLASSFICRPLVSATMLKFCLWPSNTLVTEILMELVHVLAEESKQGGLRTGLPLSLKYSSLIPRPHPLTRKMVW